jgi:hypothetical protein
MTETPGPRPGSITLLVVLAFLSGLLNIIAGAIFIFLRNDPDIQRTLSAGPNFVFWTGVGYLVVGVVTLLVAKGLSSGNSLSRFLIGLLSFVNLVYGLYGVVTHTGIARAQGIVTAVVALAMLVLLYNKRANAFFRTN